MYHHGMKRTNRKVAGMGGQHYSDLHNLFLMTVLAQC